MDPVGDEEWLEREGGGEREGGERRGERDSKTGDIPCGISG